MIKISLNHDYTQTFLKGILTWIRISTHNHIIISILVWIFVYNNHILTCIQIQIIV